MKELYSNSAFKVTRLSFPKGKMMPRHHSSTDALIFVEKGNAKLIMDDSVIDLKQGSTQLIPAFKPHEIQITDDFSACLIQESEATLKYLDNGKDKVL